MRPRGGAYNCLPTQGEHTKQYLKGLLAKLQNATAAISFRAGEPKPTDPVVLARREVQQAVIRATSPRTPFKIGVDVRQPTLKERAAGFYVRGAVTRTEQILLLRKQIEMRVLGCGWDKYETRWSSNKNAKIGTVEHLTTLLEEIFASKPPPAKARAADRAAAGAGTAEPASLKKVSLLEDSRRAANVAIGLEYFSRQYRGDDDALLAERGGGEVVRGLEPRGLGGEPVLELGRARVEQLHQPAHPLEPLERRLDALLVRVLRVGELLPPALQLAELRARRGRERAAERGHARVDRVVERLDLHHRLDLGGALRVAVLDVRVERGGERARIDLRGAAREERVLRLRPLEQRRHLHLVLRLQLGELLLARDDRRNLLGGDRAAADTPGRAPPPDPRRAAQ